MDTDDSAPNLIGNLQCPRSQFTEAFCPYGLPNSVEPRVAAGPSSGQVDRGARTFLLDFFRKNVGPSPRCGQGGIHLSAVQTHAWGPG